MMLYYSLNLNHHTNSHKVKKYLQLIEVLKEVNSNELVKDDEITGLVVSEFVKVVDQDAEAITEEYSGRAKKGISYDEDLFFGY